MKQKTSQQLLPLLLIFIFSSIHFSSVAQHTPKSLKVISYNIWNGFDWGKDLKRKDKLITWMNTQKPDILALQELCGYTKEKLLADAKKWDIIMPKF